MFSLGPHTLKRSFNFTTSARNFSASAARSKQRLVILGSGWAGYEVLRGIDKKRWDVTMISPNQYFNFTPLLASCAVGTLEFRCAVEPVQRYLPQVKAYQGWCDSINFKQKTLTCMPATPPVGSPSPKDNKSLETKAFPSMGEEFTLRYDKLVLAVGSYSQTFNVPGVKEHAHFLKDVKDARAIRTRILECFEQANQPTMSDVERKKVLNFCVVGGGPTGIEFAAELYDLLHTEMAEHYPALARMAKITIYDVAPNILGSFDKSLSTYAEKTFQRDGISILTSHNVEWVEKGRMFVKQTGIVDYGLLVWSTGLSPNPLVSCISAISKHEKSGGLITDEHLNVVRTDGTIDADVWALGDAATIKTAPLPATAQVASQKAKYLVKKLNRMVKDKDSLNKPFEFHNQGSLAYIGDWKAIYDRSGAESGPQTKETGRIAWLLWRSAYFTMTLSWRNKILVPFYWFLNWIFGRDITRF